jgi:hypothetical protein
MKGTQQEANEPLSTGTPMTETGSRVEDDDGLTVTDQKGGRRRGRRNDKKKTGESSKTDGGAATTAATTATAMAGTHTSVTDDDSSMLPSSDEKQAKRRARRKERGNGNSLKSPKTTTVSSRQQASIAGSTATATARERRMENDNDNDNDKSLEGSDSSDESDCEVGAVRVGGPYENGDSQLQLGNDVPSPDKPETNAANGDGDGEVHLLEAVLVEEESKRHIGGVVEAMPMEDADHKRWRQPLCLCLIALVITVVVAVAVVLATRDTTPTQPTTIIPPPVTDDQTPTPTPTASPQPTMAPTTPHPTMSPSAQPTQLVWTRLGRDIHGRTEGDNFGHSISLSDNGNVLAIGATAGYVRVYDFLEQDSSWTKRGEDLVDPNGNEWFGGSVSLSADGTVLAVGNMFGGDFGRVFVYRYANGSWVAVGEAIEGIFEFGEFGRYVSLSANGTTVAVGAWFADHARVYNLEEGSWALSGDTISGESGEIFGISVSLSSAGTELAVGAVYGGDSGLVRMYRQEDRDSNWVQMVSPASLSVCLGTDPWSR